MVSGCVTQYFNQTREYSNEEADKKLQGYKCVLSSKATEESMVSDGNNKVDNSVNAPSYNL